MLYIGPTGTPRLDRATSHNHLSIFLRNLKLLISNSSTRGKWDLIYLHIANIHIHLGSEFSQCLYVLAKSSNKRIYF